MEFLTNRLLMIVAFMIIIHVIDTVAYATRLSGAKVGYLASAFSLFNVLVIFSRMSNMIQQPLTGSLIDLASKSNHLESVLLVEKQFRLIILSGTIGTFMGIVLFPTFTTLFTRALYHLSLERGSIFHLFMKLFSPHYLKRAWKQRKFPHLSYLKGIKIQFTSPLLFLANVCITAIYSVGVLSSLFAALLIPENASTAIMASGLINGLATILIFLLVDPKIAILADEATKNKGNYQKLKSVTFSMLTSRLLGTILAQIIFVPSAYYAAWFTRFLL